MKPCPCCGARLFHEDGWIICYACGYEKDVSQCVCSFLACPPLAIKKPR